MGHRHISASEANDLCTDNLRSVESTRCRHRGDIPRAAGRGVPNLARSRALVRISTEDIDPVLPHGGGETMPGTIRVSGDPPSIASRIVFLDRIRVKLA